MSETNKPEYKSELVGGEESKGVLDSMITREAMTNFLIRYQVVNNKHRGFLYVHKY